MLNATGYKPLYDFDYSNYVLHRKENGTLTDIRVDDNNNPIKPVWDKGLATQDKVYFIDVDGWRDKYVLAPVGAQEDILSVTPTATPTKYQNGNTFVEATVDSTTGRALNVSGELVGTFTDSAEVKYRQETSAFIDAFSNGFQTKIDKDGQPGRWSVSYINPSGQRFYDINNSGVAGTVAPIDVSVDRAPNWTWNATAAQNYVDPLDPHRSRRGRARPPATSIASPEYAGVIGALGAGQRI